MKKFLKENLSFILIIIVVILIRSFIVTPVRVNGSSMSPTLEEKEVLLLYKLSSLEREDIVVISKDIEGSSLIKRIIGLPNEKIKCVNGTIFINDTKYDDKYGYGTTSDFDEITLKSDEYFVMGDNRIVSKDSRMIGPIKENFIEGTTSIVLYPFNKIGKIK